MANDVEKKITAKMVLDSTGFNSSIQGVNSQLKLAQSELKGASTQVGVFGKNSENLKSVQQALAQQLELQAKKVDIYRQSIEKVSTKMQENISERDKLKTALDQEKTKYQEVVQLYGKESEEAQKVKKTIGELTTEYNKKEKAVESNAKSINNYNTNMNKASAELTKIQGELNKTTNELNKSNSGWIKASDSLKVGSEHFKTVGEGANNAGNKILAMTAPLVGVGIAAAKVGMDFESEMSRVKAISQSTGEEFKQLEDQALDLGASTAFSASQVAKSQEQLASAGFKVNEIISATPGVLDLAASSGEDLATASTIAAGALRGFGLDASQSAHVADVLAKASADTNAGVASMGTAFSYVAPLARGVGWDIESVAAAVGSMADANIDGSTSGTTLRGVISRLANPSKESAGAMASLGFNAFDSAGKMKPLSTITDELNTKMKGLTDQQKQEAISTIFGQEAMSGMMVLMQKGKPALDELAKGFKNSDGSAKQMATTMQDNAKASVEQMIGSLETAGIKLEKSLAPAIKGVAETVGNLADKFANLSPSTQSAIINAVGLTVALGGTLKVVGGLASSVGSVMGLVGKFSGVMGTAKLATAGVGTAATVATGAGGVGGLAGLGAGLGGLVVAAAPWLLAGAAVVGTGYAINKAMSQEAVPAIDLFANKVTTTSTNVNTNYGMMATNVETNTIKISESTKKAVGAYVKLDDDATKALTNLFVNGSVITDQTVSGIVGKYNAMGAQIKAGMDVHYNEELTTMQQFFANSKTLSDTEEANALAGLQKSNSDKKNEIDLSNNKIYEIMQTASNNHRALTLDEQQKINEIQGTMKTNAVKSLSDNEIESKVIIDRLKEYSTRITAEQASEVIKNAEKQRTDSVDKANKQYEETKTAIENMKNTVPGFTQDMADKLIADAERQRKESVEKANKLKEDVVQNIKDMNTGVEDSVDTSSGRILTYWDKLANWWSNWKPETKTFGYSYAKVGGDPEVGGGNNTRMGGSSERWTGDDNFQGGYTTLHERGFELYDLPRSTRIYNHEASEALVTKTAEDVATKVANSVLGNINTGSNQPIYITVVSQLDGETIAKTTAKYSDKIQGNNLRLAGRGVGI